MENYIGLAAVFAAFLYSKDKRVPLVIMAYYICYILTISEFIGLIPNLDTPVSLPNRTPAVWYLMLTSINCLVVASLLSFCKRTTMVKFYAATVVITALHNTLGLFFSSLSMDWYSDIYLLHQRYAIQLDIIIAWLASDNALSRVVNRHWTKYVRRED